MTQKIEKRNNEQSALEVFGRDFELAQRIGKALSSSPMIPDNFRDVGSCMIALEFSQRTGIPVMAIMQNSYVVHGKLGFEAKMVTSMVNTCGRFSPLRFVENGKDGDDYGVYAVAKDMATGEDLVGTTITWKMVKAEGWDSKNGSKWRTMPEQMFVYRAASFWQRKHAPELTMGILTREEVEDVITVKPAEVVTDKPTLDDVTAENLKTSEKQMLVYGAAEKYWGDNSMSQLTALCKELGFFVTNATDDECDKVLEEISKKMAADEDANEGR